MSETYQQASNSSNNNNLLPKSDQRSVWFGEKMRVCSYLAAANGQNSVGADANDTLVC